MPVSGDRVFRALPWLALAAALAAVALVRLRLLGVPLERDEGEYAYIGSLLLQGVPPYAEAWNMKFPGIYAIYALLIGLGGANVVAIHAGLLVASLWNALAVAWLGWRLLGRGAAAVAGAGQAALSLSLYALGIWSHAEPFALSLSLAGILLAHGGQRVARLALAGLLLGAAVVVKQNAAPLALFGAAVVAIAQLRRARAAPLAAVGHVAAFGLAGLLPLLATMAALYLAGVFDRFWLWTFVYARSYGGQQTLEMGASNLAFILPLLLRTQTAWWALAGAGALAPLWSREVRASAPFLFGLFAAGALTASLGLYFRPQYFAPLFPAVALLAGAGVHALAPRGGRARDLVAAAVALAGLVTPIGVERRFLLHDTPEQVSRYVYGRNPFAEAVELARRIAASTAPDARIAVFGSEPEIYFYAGRRAASGYLYMYPLMENQPYALAMQEELIAQFEAAKPEYLVFVGIDTSWLAQETSPRRIFEWLNATVARHYQVIARAEIERPAETRWTYDADARRPTDRPYWVALLRRSPEPDSSTPLPPAR